MRVRVCAAALAVALWSQAGAAADQLVLDGQLDLRWVHSNGATSYLEGGPGILRFDPQHDDVRFGGAYLASRLRLGDTVTLHAVANAYGDHDRNPVDLSEFWAEVRPFPSSPWRWSARIGAFHMPVSLENRAAGWSDVYTITPSAINTWMGEEFRTIGAEFEARWLGASRAYVGDLAVVAAAYGWNDPAGALLADRGFALSDRPSTLFGGLGRPPVTFYHEIDRKPGYYAGLDWRHHDSLEVRALRYDNRADPGAATEAGGAWRTRFTSLGARLEPTERWTFIAQYLDGDTIIGPDSAGINQFRMAFHAAFGLASVEWRHERLTARFDDFHTHQLSGFFGPPGDESGHAWTVGWTHEFGNEWRLVAEWIRVSSSFPPRLEYGGASALLESQTEVALRYRLHAGW